jgi:hypothetical protein
MGLIFSLLSTKVTMIGGTHVEYGLISLMVRERLHLTANEKRAYEEQSWLPVKLEK